MSNFMHIENLSESTVLTTERAAHFKTVATARTVPPTCIKFIRPIFKDKEGEDAFIDFLSACKMCAEVDFRRCDRKYDAFPFVAKVISECLGITSLQFSGCSFKLELFNAFIKALEKNTTIMSLAFVHGELQPESIDGLKGLVAVNNHIKKFELHGESFNSDELNGLIHSMVTNTGLRTLAITNSHTIWNIDEGAGKVLTEHPRLVSLNISDNGITDSSIPQIARIIANNTTLSSLIMNDNEFGTESGVAIGAALSKNSTLVKLVAQNNIFGNKGVDAILIALSGNNNKSKLSVLGISSEEYIYDAGGVLYFLLTSNKVLRYLSIRSRIYRDSFIPLISRALFLNSSIEYMREPYNIPKKWEILERNSDNRHKRELSLASLAFFKFLDKEPLTEESGIENIKLARTQ